MALEFKSYKDDAWYDGRIVTEGHRSSRLRIKFFNFGDDEDEFVHAKKLKKLEDVDALRSRFRKISVQFQDTDCSRVERGLLVCACRPVGASGRKFYDALLRGVVHKEHQIVNGAQVCKCTFILDWIESGVPGSCTVQNICRVQDTTDEELDPALISFLNKARERIKSTFCRRLRITGAAYDLTGGHKMSISSYERDQHDVDIGGVSFVVMVENLEKGISPFTIMEFIYQQVSISCQVLVCPSLSCEAYTRGTITVNSKKNLDKLSEFLENPGHSIISSSGRPWVITEKWPAHDIPFALVQAFMTNYQTMLQSRRTETSNELKVVLSGTEEYNTAMQLKDLFWEFINHQARIHQRLLAEEAKISQLFDAEEM